MWRSLRNKLQNVKNEEFDVIGQNVAYKLRSLPREVKIILEKVINDILFEYEMGSINKYQNVTSTCQPLEPHRANQHFSTYFNFMHHMKSIHPSLQFQSLHLFDTHTRSDTQIISLKHHN